MVEAMSMTHPKFAVVGHPNKGKSSIVSSLAMDDSVQISDTPGTTTKKRSFPLRVDGKVLYELFDTPGFQRARKVLAWLKSHDVSADRRHEVVESFIHTFKDDPKFNDEIELLEPIMAGAGIIYVVDASKPYGEEYEAEMEILRWTGQPSMALINHIDDADYSEEWKRALGGYFHLIRTYNPMRATLSQHLSILESMAQLKEEWTPAVKHSMKLFTQYYEQMITQSSIEISTLVYRSVSHVETLRLSSEDVSKEEKQKLEENYKKRLRSLEVETQQKIEKIWKHEHIEKDLDHLSFEEMDLFSEETASLFGLNKKELLLTAAASGAATGAGVDLLLAGSTMMLGAGIGAVVGGVGALFAFNELSEIKVMGQTLGKRYLEIGPMGNRNFPYILLGRALYHTIQMANRSHALREKADISMDSTFKAQWLDDKTRQALEKFHQKFRTSATLDEKILQQYEALIQTILHQFIAVK